MKHRVVWEVCTHVLKEPATSMFRVQASFKLSTPAHYTTRCHIPKDVNLNIHHYENLESHCAYVIIMVFWDVMQHSFVGTSWIDLQGRRDGNRFLQTSDTIYQTALYHIPEDCNLNIRHYVDPTSHCAYLSHFCCFCEYSNMLRTLSGRYLIQADIFLDTVQIFTSKEQHHSLRLMSYVSLNSFISMHFLWSTIDLSTICVLLAIQSK
jgi:hypothetical protein